MKKCILVLGMHRSGTSAVSGVINILGAYSGSELLDAHITNPKGFFEDKKIIQLNDYILANNFNTSWFDEKSDGALVEKMPKINSGIYDELFKYILNITYRDNPIIAIKDPRMCLLLPCYQRALFELGYDIYCIRTIRDKNEIAESLIARKKIIPNVPEHYNKETFVKLSEKYNLCLDEHLKLFPHHLLIAYTDLINNTNYVISEIKQYLPFLNYDDDSLKKVCEFIEPSLKHH